MKQYEVIYGNDAWRDSVKVWAKSSKSARMDVEQELRNGVSIIKIIEV